MNRVPEAKHWHRLWSIRLAALSAGLAAMEASIHLWSDVVPAGVFAVLSSVVAVSAAVARVIKQSLPHE